MKIEQSVIDALINNPSENLAVEIKQWIDPTISHGIAKIAKGLLALRNQDGGFLVIGFNDKTLQPDLQGPPNAKDIKASGLDKQNLPP
jgi:predicted HTH transcriptional regulator